MAASTLGSRIKQLRQTGRSTHPKICPLTFYRKGFLTPVLHLKLICVLFLPIMCVHVSRQVYMYVGAPVCGPKNMCVYKCVAIRGHS